MDPPGRFNTGVNQTLCQIDPQVDLTRVSIKHCVRLTPRSI